MDGCESAHVCMNVCMYDDVCLSIYTCVWMCLFPLFVDDIEWPVRGRVSSVNESSSSMRILLCG